MRISIRLFATLRDRAGREHIRIELTQPANVMTLMDQLAGEYPALAPLLPSALVAINQEYAFPENALEDGDEVALFPPVSGGSGVQDWPEYFSITQDTLDIDQIVAHIVRPETGATYVFVGAVRGATHRDDQTIQTDHLVYEAYEPMAEQKLHQIAAEIRQRYPRVQGIAIVQRLGTLRVGEPTVLVACSAGHRNDGCLDAAHYGIDRLKEIVPVWKKEVSPTGSTWVEGTYRPTPKDVWQVSSPQLTDALSEHDGIFIWGCPECGERYPWASPHLTQCKCGSPLEAAISPPFDRGSINQQDTSLWRYQAMLAPPNVKRVTLGEGWTPLVTVEVHGKKVWLKLEGLNPTGSFKDRGSALVLSTLKSQGVTTVHDDSSGNAGAALAAYAAHAGLAAQVFCPETASPHKLGQIGVYGAKLTTIAGPRNAAAQAALQAAATGQSVYASHVYNPFAILAYKSIAYELWEQLDYRAPDSIVLPVGQGSQLLGISWGFQDLLRAGHIDYLPSLIAVQAQACAPLWHSFQHRNTPTIEATEHPTVAEGVAIINPVRSKQVLRAIADSGGEVIAVTEEEIRLAVSELAHHGILAEPTSAAAWAALKQVAARAPQNATIVLSVTGSGLKSPNLQDFA